MKNSKLIIMSIDKKYTVGYTEDGQFLKIPKKPTHRVGQIINYQPAKTSGLNPRIMAIASAILLVFFTGIFNPFFQQEAAAAYLSMGLNTGSLELWTDANNKVIKTNYTKSLDNLNQLDLNGKDIYEAVSILALEAKRNGLITKGENDILLIDLIDLQENTNHHIAEDKLKKVILEGLTTNEYQGLMMMERHDKEYLTKANELNLTASQYHIYEASSSKGHKLEMEKFQHGHIRNILKENGTSPEEIFDIHSNMMQNNKDNGKMHSNMMQNNNNTGNMSSQENTNMHSTNELTPSDPNHNMVTPKHNQKNMMDQDTEKHDYGKMPMYNENKMHN